MKDALLPALQFSGYPLFVADLHPKPSLPAFILARRPQEGQTTFIQKNAISNDPVNWDQDWFGGYE